MKKNRIIFLIFIVVALVIPQILFSQSYYNTYGHIDINLRDETFVDDTGRHVTVKIYKDADDIGTNRIISGLDNYDKRVELYRDVIMNLVTQPKCQSVDLIYEEAEQGVSKEELFAQAAVLYKAGSFSVNLLDYIAQHANLGYIPGSNQTAQMVNSWKHMMRQVNHSNLHNVSNALGAISLILNTIEMGDRVAAISSNYILLKALEMDLAHERLRLLEQYCNIDDDAFTEALALVTNDMNILPQSDWNKILVTLRNQGTEVEKLIITAGQSLNTLGSLLAHMPKPSPITGWIFAGLFTWQTGVMIQEHKDHMRTSSLAATIYANMQFPEQPEKMYELSEYAQYLFVDEFWLAFDNWATWVLSWFSQSWYEVREAWQNESNYLLGHIHRRRVEEAVALLDQQPEPPQTQPPTHDNMVFVQGGTFQMGSNDTYYPEKPVHTVTVSDFYIGKYEVTQKEWKEVMDANPSYWKGDNLPVEKVSWYDAVEFCNIKSEMEDLQKCYSINKSKKDPNNKNEYDNLKWTVTCNFNANGYRLPTEAEWEYAARGGNQSRGYTYSGSNDLDEVAWHFDWDNGFGEKAAAIHQIGQKHPNELNIYDMSGNSEEWCNDWYDDDYYSSSPRNDPTGPSSGSYRVVRGSDSSCLNFHCYPVAHRSSKSPNQIWGNAGFRLVRAVESK